MTSFLLSRLSMVVIAAIFGLVVLDIKKHGSFTASKTGTFLKDSGALYYGSRAWSNFRANSQQVYRWCQKNVPSYVTSIRESAGPHLKKVLIWLTTAAHQLWTNVKLACGYFIDKKPAIEQWIDHYAPGLTDSVGTWLKQLWILIKEYTAWLSDMLLKYTAAAVEWLREYVFAGSLSPENLQKYTMEALNTTQQLAVKTFSWLNNKVVTVISAS